MKNKTLKQFYKMVYDSCKINIHTCSRVGNSNSGKEDGWRAGI